MESAYCKKTELLKALTTNGLWRYVSLPPGQSTGMAALNQHWCHPEVAAKSV